MPTLRPRGRQEGGGPVATWVARPVAERMYFLPAALPVDIVPYLHNHEHSTRAGVANNHNQLGMKQHGIKRMDKAVGTGAPSQPEQSERVRKGNRRGKEDKRQRASALEMNKSPL